MNEFAKATILKFVSNIAAVVSLFKFNLPYVKSALKDCHSNLENLDLLDTHSLNIEFYLPRISKFWSSLYYFNSDTFISISLYSKCKI